MKKPTDFHSFPPSQEPVGRRPSLYISELPDGYGSYCSSINAIPGFGNDQLSRAQLITLSHNVVAHPLVVYACIMAWGGRDFGNFRLSLAGGNANRLIVLIEHLRGSGRTRIEDFEFTQKAAEDIPGLGISFYTKLLFFLRQSPDAYILDQWTAKSAAVVFPQLGIKLTAAGLPDPKTNAEIYNTFCYQLEACCGHENWGAAWTTGEEVERTIFDRPRGGWRTWLKVHLGEEPNLTDRSKPAREITEASVGRSREQSICRLTEQLRTTYLAALDTGLSLPESCGRFAKPNRLYVRLRDGFLFQFVINQKGVRAQILFNGMALSAYSDIVKTLKPADNGISHDFGGGITGNGPKSGKTRAIDLTASVHGGWGAPESVWLAVCESAVEAMAELFGFCEPHLKSV